MDRSIAGHLVELGRGAKKSPHREIQHIDRKLSTSIGTLGLWLYATACGPTVVDLGARGHSLVDGGGGGLAAISGAGGVAGEDRTRLGFAGGAAAAGAAAASGAGSGGSSPDKAGTSAPPDAGVADMAPVPSPGCGLQPPPATDTSITLGASTASYIVDVVGYDRNRPYPLVISFRGAKVTAAAFRRYLDLPTAVGADGIVVNVDCADAAETWDMQRDLPFFDALLAKLESKYCVDLRRVFVVGHATGAIFANSIACTHAGALRGLGSLSGAAPIDTCAGRLAVWISQGNADANRQFGWADRDFWVQQNRCTNVTAMVDPAPCLEYAGCEIGCPVRYCEYNGTLDLPTFAASGVWNFFKAL